MMDTRIYNPISPEERGYPLGFGVLREQVRLRVHAFAKDPGIWGGAYSPYPKTLLMPCVAIWLLTAGILLLKRFGFSMGDWAIILSCVLSLTFPLGIILWARVKRRSALCRLSHISMEGFASQVRRIAPEVPELFVGLVRISLAYAYRIPATRLSPENTASELRDLSRLSPPSIAEVIVGLFGLGSIQWERQELLYTAEQFRGCQPSNVADLIKQLYEKLTELNLIQGTVFSTAKREDRFAGNREEYSEFCDRLMLADIREKRIFLYVTAIVSGSVGISLIVLGFWQMYLKCRWASDKVLYFVTCVPISLLILWTGALSFKQALKLKNKVDEEKV